MAPFSPMPRSAVSPRVFQLYSPRHPSPLGLPPLAPHGSQDGPCSAYPQTPERYYHHHQPQSSGPTSGHGGMRFPPDAHRPLGTNTQRGPKAPPPAPLNLDAQDHPASIPLPSIERNLQPPTPDMLMPTSPTPSSTSSLSLYSSESAKRSLSVIQEEQEEEERKKGGGGGGFCLCFNFSALFGTKSKPNKKVQPPIVTAEPAPAPQMVQSRRRPPSLVLVR